MTNTHKDIINAALHEYLHDDTELEMDVKDTVVELYEKARAYDEIKIEHLPFEGRMSPIETDEVIDFAIGVEKIILKLERTEHDE